MCRHCDYSTAMHATPLPRRSFLKFAGAAAAGLVMPRNSFAQKAPPKPENIVSPDGALDLLMKGNGRYVEGVSRRHDFKHEREALTKGQNPYAAFSAARIRALRPNMPSIQAAATCSCAAWPAIS
jgi:carbonic anhydrase